MYANTRVFALLAMGALMLSGCKLFTILKDACDYDSGSATATCRPTFELRSHKSPVTASELAAFDASGLIADVGEGNAPVISRTSTATIRLKVDGATYASNTFTVRRDGDEMSLSQPAQVNRWLRSHAVGADSIELSIDGVRVGSVHGTNVFSLVLKYLGQEVGGTTASWRHSRIPEGDFRRMQ
jgi:hypothetical protein